MKLALKDNNGYKLLRTLVNLRIPKFWEYRIFIRFVLAKLSATNHIQTVTAH